MSATSLTETGRLWPEETSTDGIEGCHQNHDQRQYQFYISSNSISEIEEEEDDDDDGSREVPKEVKELFEMREFAPMPPIREDQQEKSSSSCDDSVYVAVGKSESSMDALTWTVKHAINPSSSTMVYLIHIFPEVRYIPSPLGKLPVNQVSPEQVKTYMAQEGGKRSELLQKFLATCSAAKVKVDTVMIESDSVGKAILDLIPILNIRKLVLGTSKSNSRKLRSRRGSGTLADQILKGAPESCEIKIISEGNEVKMDQPPPESSPSPRGNADDSKYMQDEDNKLNQSFSCSCFKPKFS
ncbi:hypothetical protein FEM48_Zijuj01G0089700 [Ziziphus jujuba var. spinosa]|uniref:U-box domain-containing protein 35-like n=1 Tax=Ziziphus jujuba var. spinosa TaxID=714518 RepID=A0A978W0B8_ZIZJJ|nr:hypothetical protein FEM48_Zijuj01G0089700 [Ziziphus jujuba var. spinosa]